LREELEWVEATIRVTAARGLRVAVHLVLTANRWYDVRTNLRDNIPGRLELRLNDAAESEIDRRAALTIPAGVPGRGLSPAGNQLQVALPWLGGPMESVVGSAETAWGRPGAPPLRLL